MTAVRVVLDTNVWLDWLVFGDPCVAAIREAHAAGRIEICVSAEGEAELERVLAYERGRRTLAQGAQAACMARCRSLALRIDAGLAAAERAKLPVCRDRDDQKFLDAALAAGAEFLVTKDKALLELALRRARGERAVPFRIVAPADFAEITKPRAAPLRT
jgi:uncharacterized protein